MKTNKLAQLCKKRKCIILYLAPDDIQWIGDGSAAYPAYGFPEMDEESLYTIFDIPEKDQKKIHYQNQAFPDGLSYKDIIDGENKLEALGHIDIAAYGRTLRPLQTQMGLVFIDTKYLAPLADIEEAIDLYERIDNDGGVYIAVKAGMTIRGIIMPYALINDEFVEELEELTRLCKVAWDIDQLRKNGEAVQIELS